MNFFIPCSPSSLIFKNVSSAFPMYAWCLEFVSCLSSLPTIHLNLLYLFSFFPTSLLLYIHVFSTSSFCFFFLAYPSLHIHVLCWTATNLLHQVALHGALFLLLLCSTSICNHTQFPPSIIAANSISFCSVSRSSGSRLHLSPSKTLSKNPLIHSQNVPSPRLVRSPHQIRSTPNSHLHCLLTPHQFRQHDLFPVAHIGPLPPL